MSDMQLIRPTQAKCKMFIAAAEVVWSREGQMWSNYTEKIQQLACYTLGYAYGLREFCWNFCPPVEGS